MKFILYGKTDCKHCEEAKVEIRKFLEQLPDSYHGEIFDIFYINNEEEKDVAVRRVLATGNPPPRTVPITFFIDDSGKEIKIKITNGLIDENLINIFPLDIIEEVSSHIVTISSVGNEILEK